MRGVSTADHERAGRPAPALLGPRCVAARRTTTFACRGEQRPAGRCS